MIVTRFLSDHAERVAFTILGGSGKGGFADVTARVVTGAVPRLLWPRDTVVADFSGDGHADVFFADTGFDQQPWGGTTQTLLLSSSGGKLVDATPICRRTPSRAPPLPRT